MIIQREQPTVVLKTILNGLFNRKRVGFFVVGGGVTNGNQTNLFYLDFIDNSEVAVRADQLAHGMKKITIN